jgi:hypothetical protein
MRTSLRNVQRVMEKVEFRTGWPGFLRLREVGAADSKDWGII